MGSAQARAAVRLEWGLDVGVAVAPRVPQVSSAHIGHLGILRAIISAQVLHGLGSPPVQAS